MKAYNGFKAEASNKIEALPAGPYVAVIKAVKIDGQEPDQALILRMDVAEGPYAGYFLDRYQKETRKAAGKYEPRYKGDFRLRIPNDANTKALYPESDKKRFGDAVYRIEKSNPDYHWDWNEQGLVGLVVGINMQQDEFNGVPFTKIGRLEIADDVRAGTVTAMPPRERRDAPAPQVDRQSGMVKAEDAELPWF
jgi:hypothetical protein